MKSESLAFGSMLIIESRNVLFKACTAVGQNLFEEGLADPSQEPDLYKFEFNDTAKL